MKKFHVIMGGFIWKAGTHIGETFHILMLHRRGAINELWTPLFVSHHHHLYSTTGFVTLAYSVPDSANVPILKTEPPEAEPYPTCFISTTAGVAVFGCKAGPARSSGEMTKDLEAFLGAADGEGEAPPPPPAFLPTISSRSDRTGLIDEDI